MIWPAPSKRPAKKGAVTVRGIKVGSGADTRFVDVTVQEIEEPEELRGMVLVVFSDAVIQAETL
jgi:hypothetical protein